jgi:hypothetical protein
MEKFKTNLDKLKKLVAYLYALPEYEDGLDSVVQLLLNGVTGTNNMADAQIAEELRALHGDLEDFKVSAKGVGINAETAEAIWSDINDRTAKANRTKASHGVNFAFEAVLLDHASGDWVVLDHFGKVVASGVGDDALAKSLHQITSPEDLIRMVRNYAPYGAQIIKGADIDKEARYGFWGFEGDNSQKPSFLTKASTIINAKLVTKFKLNKDVDLDWYSFKAGVWHGLGGDFLTNPTPSKLLKVFEEENVDLSGLTVEFK